MKETKVTPKRILSLLLVLVLLVGMAYRTGAGGLYRWGKDASYGALRFWNKQPRFRKNCGSYFAEVVFFGHRHEADFAADHDERLEADKGANRYGDVG